MGGREAAAILKRAVQGFTEDDCPRMAAALSYYTVFALPPLLVLLLILLGAVVDSSTAREAVEGRAGALLGAETAGQLLGIVDGADRPSGRGLSAAWGALALLLGATGAFLQLQAALNRAWKVDPGAGGGVRGFVLKRFLSLGMILAVAFLLLVSLALSAAISRVGTELDSVVPWASEPLLHLLNLTLGLGVTTLLFAAVFRVLPDASVAWRDVWGGAAATAALFLAGSFALGIYLGRSDPGSAFGAAASLSLVLVWIYYSSMIVLFGAELTRAWIERRGGAIGA